MMSLELSCIGVTMVMMMMMMMMMTMMTMMVVVNLQLPKNAELPWSPSFLSIFVQLIGLLAIKINGLADVWLPWHNFLGGGFKYFSMFTPTWGRFPI